MKILITGATGFVGKALTQKLIEKNHSIIVLSRNPDSAKHLFGGKVEAIAWDATKGEIPKTAWNNVDGVIHLAGDTVAQLRWTDAVKKSIYDSRVLGTQNLIRSLESSGQKLKFFIGASAIGFYDSGFLAKVCKDWESAMSKVSADRTVILRLGVVFGKSGGALSKMLPAFRLGLGGPVGNGNQWMSWIHLDDLVQMFLLATEDSKWTGVYDATSPEPITNAEFTKTLGSVLRRPAFLRAPEFALKLVLGEMAEETLLASQKVFPKKALEQGFVFRYSNIKKTLEGLC